MDQYELEESVKRAKAELAFGSVYLGGGVFLTLLSAGGFTFQLFTGNLDGLFWFSALALPISGFTAVYGIQLLRKMLKEKEKLASARASWLRAHGFMISVASFKELEFPEQVSTGGKRYGTTRLLRATGEHVQVTLEDYDGKYRLRDLYGKLIPQESEDLL